MFTRQWTGGEAAGGQLTGPNSDMNHLPTETLQSSACVEGNVRFFRGLTYPPTEEQDKQAMSPAVMSQQGADMLKVTKPMTGA